ncbi:MAG TPA: hypothetical protein VLH75_12635 [Longimicrobiales bacterium]|nr:hypothetical protein [Longimicrobiales bacterium]
MIRRAQVRTGLAAVALVAASAAGVGAQTTSRLGVGPMFESYTFADPAQAGIESITLLSTPFAARAGLGRRATLEVGGAYAAGKVTSGDGSESELTGLTDTHVMLHLAVVPDALTLSVMAAAPTGRSTHDAAQALVAGVVSADLLPFRVSSWGGGGGVGMQLAATRRFEGFGAGVSVGYRQAGEFEPLEAETFAYRPGNEIQARLALDTEVGRNGKGSLVVGFQRFGDDALDGANLFRSGNRIEAIGTYAFPMGYGGSAALYGGVLHRSQGSYLDATVPGAPTQDLVLMGGMLRRGMGSGFLTPRADVRVFRSGDGVGQGYVAGVGAAYEMRAGNVTLAPSVTGRIGQVTVREGQESGITGFEAGLTLRFGR